MFSSSQVAASSVPPLGLAYLAAATREAGHDVVVLDATGEALDRFQPRATPVGDVLVQGLTIPEIVARVDPACEVVGVSNMFLHQWPLLRDLLAALRRARPDIAIVLGGENATAFWETMMRDAPAIDLCVLGEGEATFTAVLAALAKHDQSDILEDGRAPAPAANDRPRLCASARARLPAIAELPQLAWRGPEGPARTPAGPRIDALDELPLAAAEEAEEAALPEDLLGAAA